MTIQVGILLFDDVEVLDFAGPFEVFTTASRVAARRNAEAAALFAVVTIAAANQVRARAGLSVNVDCSLQNAPPLDLLIVPGGVVEAELQKPEVVQWIAERAAAAQWTASICTGAFLLAAAGLLAGRPATTHWEDVDDLRARFPQVRVMEGVRWVDDGDVLTSGGISAGIDLALHLVARLASEELAAATARQMEFDRQVQP
jgi:transcriptional regulator GlxA family with amidase domain